MRSAGVLSSRHVCVLANQFVPATISPVTRCCPVFHPFLAEHALRRRDESFPTLGHRFRCWQRREREVGVGTGNSSASRQGVFGDAFATPYLLYLLANNVVCMCSDLCNYLGRRTITAHRLGCHLRSVFLTRKQKVSSRRDQQSRLGAFGADHSTRRLAPLPPSSVTTAVHMV